MTPRVLTKQQPTFHRRAALVIAFGATLSFVSLPAAHAQPSGPPEAANASTAPPRTPSNAAAAQVLFDEGLKLKRARSFEAACQKFEASLDLDDSVSTWGQLAECYEATDRKADAWAAWKRVKARTSARPDQRAFAEKRIAELEPQLAYLTVVVPGARPGLEVHRGDRLVPKAEYGVAVPANQGVHRISVTAPGHQATATTVSLADGERRTVTLEPLTPTAKAAPRVDPSPVETAAVPAPLPGIRRDAPRRRTRSLRWVALGSAATGVVALSVAGGLAFSADRARDRARDLGCEEDLSLCPHSVPRASDEASKAYDRAGLATITAFAGVGLVVAGGALHLFTRGGDGDRREESAVRLGVATSPGHVLVTVGGSL